MTEGTIIKTCVDRVLPVELRVEAARLAVAENPANNRTVQFSPSMGAGPLPDSFLALLKGKKWQSGRTLRVRFLEGQPAVQAKVEQFAHEWEKYCSIKFAFGNDPDADIRIAFQNDGSWSYIGTDALVQRQSEPTMNYGWFTERTPDEEFSRVTIHEFGHALGCIHEHQNPAGNIPWNKEAVYRYYGGPPNNWSRQDVDFNLFERYSRDVTQFTDLDPASIMMYPIPKDLTIGGFEVGWNTVLSPTDKDFMGKMYPTDEKPSVELKIGGPGVQASIGAHGEEDYYKFVVAAPGRYAVETGGWTNVVMTLYGPDDQGLLVAENDNGGWWFNARIATTLNPGTYFVRVRHHRPTGTGSYTISVTSLP